MNKLKLKPILTTMASALNVGADVLWAITSIESSGSFSIGGGKIPILVERHWVYKLYKRKHGKSAALALSRKYPDVCNPRAGGYGRYRDQYKRLSKAIRIAGAEIAHQSTSFGAFQIMGFNHKLCGFDTAVEMSDAYHSDPKNEQIKGFLNFCKSYKNGRLLDAMKASDFNKVAYLYNGPMYKKNHYAQRMYTAAGEWRRFEYDYSIEEFV
jgi:hypothetical protein